MIPPRVSFTGLALLASFAACGTSEPPAQYAPAEPPTDAPLASTVDPFIGTAGDGMTFPGAVVPWGMASPSPHTTLTTPLDALFGNFVNGGYRQGEPLLRGFGLTHLSGVGCPEFGLPVVAPTTGAVPRTADDYAIAYRDETAHAGYYSVELGNTGLAAEMTATPRTGVFRFWFPGNEPANLLIDAANGVSWTRGDARIDAVSATEVVGSAAFGGFCAQSGSGRVYFVARVDRPAEEFGLIQAGETRSASEGSGDVMAFLRYGTAPRSPVTVWIGLSWVSTDAARRNLDAEQAPFDNAREAASRSWQEELGRIEVEGGSESDRTRFYTALYHSLIHPSVLQDVDGTYPSFLGNEVANADGDPRYTVFSLWDTYRTVHPLLTLVYPEVQLAMLRSLEDMASVANAPPKWELIADEVQMMVGDPAAIVVADSYLKGLTAFDAAGLYQTMATAAETVAHRPASDDYRRLGYVPIEREGEVWGPVSTTLEYSVADASLSALAQSLGASSASREGASAYEQLFDVQTGTLRPKNADGTFLEPFDPDALMVPGALRLGGPGYVEGTGWHYAFFVPHDVPGLIALHGEDRFLERLRMVFDTDRFVMWNEPDLHYPYLFTYLEGEAWQTQREVRGAMERYYSTDADGIPGNDDAGALSAWFVFSAMGFYPVDPTSAEYRLGSPLFRRITLHLSDAHHDGDTFVIDAPENGPETVYVRGTSLNGQTWLEPALSHRAITQGGTLTLEMSGTPISE